MKTIRKREKPVSDSRKRLLGAVALIGLMTAGCAGDAELDTLQPQSANARDIDTLLDRVLVIAGVIGVLLLLLLLVQRDGVLRAALGERHRRLVHV